MPPVTSTSSTTTFTNRIRASRTVDATEIFVDAPTATKPSYSSTTQTTIQPIQWKFRGHSCYAEISTPMNGPVTSAAAASPTGAVTWPFHKFQSWFSGIGSSNQNGRNKQQVKDRDGLDVILIHGFGCSTTYWRETRKALNDAGHTVHSIDLLGQGRSSKPTRSPNNGDNENGVLYSIDLWAEQLDTYAAQYTTLRSNNSRIVLVGNSLGSVVALSAATGDWLQGSRRQSKAYKDNVEGLDGDNKKEVSKVSFLSTGGRVRGLCFFNCGIGMNSRNLVKTIDSAATRTVFNVLFDLLDLLVFDNPLLLSYAVNNLVSEETLRNVLLTLYKCADDPASRVDDELVKSFVEPVANDETWKVVDVIRQIYTNDGGKTPMELHELYPSVLNSTPIHLIWGDRDNITPLSGSVGKFYSKLASRGRADGDEKDDSPNNNTNVSLQVIQAGHIPFDERPECNHGLVEWLEFVVLQK